MKKVVYAVSVLSVTLLLASCSGETETTQTETTVDSVTAGKAPSTVIDSAKIYPFMELKELYAIDWKGETKGNTALDGKTVTITGEIFSSGEITAYIDGKFVPKGFNMKFRGSQFKDPDFGHDVECSFPAKDAKKLQALKRGTKVTVRGVIEKQEEYIESADLQYFVLCLKDCQVVK